MMLALGMVLALDLLYFAIGSLEMFPTAEQQEKVRIVTGAIALLLLCAEIGLWALLRSAWAREARSVS